MNIFWCFTNICFKKRRGKQQGTIKQSKSKSRCINKNLPEPKQTHNTEQRVFPRQFLSKTRMNTPVRSPAPTYFRSFLLSTSGCNGGPCGGGAAGAPSPRVPRAPSRRCGAVGRAPRRLAPNRTPRAARDNEKQEDTLTKQQRNVRPARLCSGLSPALQLTATKLARRSFYRPPLLGKTHTNTELAEILDLKLPVYNSHFKVQRFYLKKAKTKVKRFSSPTRSHQFTNTEAVTDQWLTIPFRRWVCFLLGHSLKNRKSELCPRHSEVLTAAESS